MIGSTMKMSMTTLFCLLCVGLTHSVTDVEFELVLQYIDLLKSQVLLLKSNGQSSQNAVPRDCADIQALGEKSSGIYNVYIGNPPRPTQVYCDMTTDGGGWLVFQRRRDGTVDFYRTWSEYSAGFGYPGGEFWLGNNDLFWLTAANNMKRYELRIDLEDFNGTRRYAKYSEFKIASERVKYKLVLLGSYTGTAGDSLSVHKKSAFSTPDRDNDNYPAGSCATTYKGAWWYKSCHSSNLNGLYLGGPHTSYADGVEWRAWTGYHYSLKTSEMKIRPVSL